MWAPHGCGMLSLAWPLMSAGKLASAARPETAARSCAGLAMGTGCAGGPGTALQRPPHARHSPAAVAPAAPTHSRRSRHPCGRTPARTHARRTHARTHGARTHAPQVWAWPQPRTASWLQRQRHLRPPPLPPHPPWPRPPLAPRAHPAPPAPPPPRSVALSPFHPRPAGRGALWGAVTLMAAAVAAAGAARSGMARRGARRWSEGGAGRCGAPLPAAGSGVGGGGRRQGRAARWGRGCEGRGWRQRVRCGMAARARGPRWATGDAMQCGLRLWLLPPLRACGANTRH